MLYQRKHLADGSNVGQPGPLPAELVGLQDSSLADLGWTDASLGYRGDAFVPYTPPPVSARLLSVRDFVRRFTNGELVAIMTASTGDPQLRVLMTLLQSGPDVDLDHPDTISALGYLTAQNLIAAGRADTIRT